MALDRRTFLAAGLGGGLVLLAAACRSGSDGGPRAESTSPLSPASPLPPPATSGPKDDAASVPHLERPAVTAESEPTAPTALFVTSGRDRGSAPRPEVALTFHTNGDLHLAQRLVDTAAEYDARFTCFIVGSWLEANPSWARKLVDRGHELANHTYSHPDFAALEPTRMITEIIKCRDVIARLTGDGGRYFRPSGTDDGLARPNDAVMAAAAQAGYGIVLGWDVDPYDYRDPGADAVRDRVLAGVQAGSIVSLHFGHKGTLDALEEILGGLAAKGLRAVTATELLS